MSKWVKKKIPFTKKVLSRSRWGMDFAWDTLVQGQDWGGRGWGAIW